MYNDCKELIPFYSCQEIKRFIKSSNDRVKQSREYWEKVIKNPCEIEKRKTTATKAISCANSVQKSLQQLKQYMYFLRDFYSQTFYADSGLADLNSAWKAIALSVDSYFAMFGPEREERRRRLQSRFEKVMRPLNLSDDMDLEAIRPPEMSSDSRLVRFLEEQQTPRDPHELSSDSEDSEWPPIKDALSFIKENPFPLTQYKQFDL